MQQHPHPHPQPQVVVVNQQSQVVPALLNAFCWPGLGHFVQGRLLAGLIWLCLWGFSLALCFVVVGIFLAPIVWSDDWQLALGQ